MNTKLCFTTMFLFCVTFLSVRANDLVTKNYSRIEDNLIVGVTSENDGLKISSAYYLGEMKSRKAVNYLMKMLREDKNPSARLMAALSLVKIEDEQGLFLVKRTAIFNTNEKVRRMSEKFYNSYLQKKYQKNYASNSLPLAQQN